MQDVGCDSLQDGGPRAWYYWWLCIGCVRSYSPRRCLQLALHLCYAAGKGHDSSRWRGAKSWWAVLKHQSACLGSQRRHLEGHPGLKAGDRGHSSNGFGKGRDSLLIDFPQMRTESSKVRLRNHQRFHQHLSGAHPAYTGQGFHNTRVFSIPEYLGSFDFSQVMLWAFIP